MGLFGAIKTFFALRKNLAKELEAIREREARYPAMTTDELAALDDEELFEAVNVRTENKVDSFEELTDGFHSLNDSQKVFYALNWLEMEVNSEGCIISPVPGILSQLLFEVSMFSPELPSTSVRIRSATEPMSI